MPNIKHPEPLQIEPLTPLLIDAVGAMKLLGGISKSLFYEMASSGRLGPMPVEFNSKKLYSVPELRRWVDAKCPSRDKWIAMQEVNND